MHHPVQEHKLGDVVGEGERGGVSGGTGGWAWVSRRAWVRVGDNRKGAAAHQGMHYLLMWRLVPVSLQRRAGLFNESQCREHWLSTVYLAGAPNPHHCRLHLSVHVQARLFNESYQNFGGATHAQDVVMELFDILYEHHHVFLRQKWLGECSAGLGEEGATGGSAGAYPHMWPARVTVSTDDISTDDNVCPGYRPMAC